MSNAELHYILGAVGNCAEKKGNNVYSKVFSWATSAARTLKTKRNSGVKKCCKGQNAFTSESLLGLGGFTFNVKGHGENCACLQDSLCGLVPGFTLKWAMHDQT